MEEVLTTPDLLSLLHERGAPKDLRSITRKTLSAAEQSYKSRLKSDFGLSIPDHLVVEGIYRKLYDLLEPHRNDLTIYTTLWMTYLDSNQDNVIPKILLFNQKIRLNDELVRQIIQTGDRELISIALDQLQSLEYPIRVSDDTLITAIAKCNIDISTTLLRYNLSNNYPAVVSSGPLIAAIKHCRTISLVEELMKVSKSYQGVLEAAIIGREYEMIQLLAASGKIGTDAALLEAAKKGDIKTAEALLADSNVYTSNALIVAMKRGDTGLVGILLDDRRADLNNPKVLELILNINSFRSRSREAINMVIEEKKHRPLDLITIDQLSPEMTEEIIGILIDQGTNIPDDALTNSYHQKLLIADTLAEREVFVGNVTVLKNLYFRESYLLTNDQLANQLNEVDIPKIPNMTHLSAALLLAHELDPERPSYLIEELLFGVPGDAQYWIKKLIL
ncbi:Hypothetical protein POVR1_LOCUS229 [uncultured virus]|nr:Hypothetical protein POVR1_LOCUS229 [uncultured virus]